MQTGDCLIQFQIVSSITLLVRMPMWGWLVGAESDLSNVASQWMCAQTVSAVGPLKTEYRTVRKSLTFDERDQFRGCVDAGGAIYSPSDPSSTSGRQCNGRCV
jgi:hypothetical protein